MPKPKAPRWLTQSFADGVGERQPPAGLQLRTPYPGADPNCFLARHDKRRRPCKGRLERCHLINRQRIEAAMWEMLRGDLNVFDPESIWIGFSAADRRDFTLLAAWDSRIAELGCAGEHHARFDSRQTPTLHLDAADLPTHALDFIHDYGLEAEAERRFANFTPRLERIA